MTDYEYEVQGNYGYGWECLTTEDSRADALAQARTYDENEPSTPHRVRRVKIARTCAFVSDGTPGTGDHHSPDVIAVYHGRLEPVYVCGYHASRPDCMVRVFASVTR